VLTITALLIAGCAQEEQQQEQTVQSIAVKVLVLQERDREVLATYTGSLEGERQAVLYAKLAETVDSIWVDEGRTVTAGQVIVSLDKTGPSTSYSETRATFLNTEKTYRKMEFLYKEGAVSELDFDAARTSFEVSRAAFEAVNRLVEVQTPIAGVVTSVDVNPGDQVHVGQALATVATTRNLRVRFGVNANDVVEFRAGSQVRISSDAVAGTANGTIVTVASSANPISRAFEVEALIDNAAGMFAPGMFVRVHIVKERLGRVIAIPRQTLLELDNKKTVYTIVDGKAQPRVVTLGADLLGEVVVTSGLKSGDTLITLGQNYVEDGVPTNITELNEQVL